MEGVDGIEDLKALCQSFLEFIDGQKEKILERLPRLKKEKEEDRKQERERKAEERERGRRAKEARPRLTGSEESPTEESPAEESPAGVVTFSEYEMSLRRTVLLNNSIQAQQRLVPTTEGQQHSAADINTGHRALTQEDDAGSGQPPPDFIASSETEASDPTSFVVASRQAKEAAEVAGVRHKARGPRQILRRMSASTCILHPSSASRDAPEEASDLARFVVATRPAIRKDSSCALCAGAAGGCALCAVRGGSRVLCAALYAGSRGGCSVCWKY